MKEIGINAYLVVSAIVFSLGVLGIFLNQRSLLALFMSIELIFLAINLNFVAFSSHLGDLSGQVFSLFILTVAAAEAAIGLAILVIYYRNRTNISVEEISALKG